MSHRPSVRVEPGQPGPLNVNLCNCQLWEITVGNCALCRGEAAAWFIISLRQLAGCENHCPGVKFSDRNVLTTLSSQPGQD